jgi:superfamily II DNA or RNA helicase
MSDLEDIKIQDFLPKYPNIFPFSKVILNPYSQDFYESIYRKKEFYEKRLAPVEPKPDTVGSPLRHQEIISRFLSSNTLYDTLLLFHEMGTGKTGVSVAVAELLKTQLLADSSSIALLNRPVGAGISRTLVLMRGKSLIDNYIQELVFTNTKGQYIPDDYDKFVSKEVKYRRVKKKVSEFYDFDTFEVFAKDINKKSDQEIIRDYSNRLIVIDEVHNIRISSEDINIYRSIHRFLHIIKNSKILLMTATPMKDKPQEIASILNLILPIDSQLPTGEQFIRDFMDKGSREDLYFVKKSKIPVLGEYFKGRISYLKSQRSAVRKEFVGKKVGNLQKFVVKDLDMDPFQSQHYATSYKKDTGSVEEKGIYSNSRQASLFVFPDGSWGSEGFRNNITERKIEDRNIYELSTNFKRYLYQEGKDSDSIIGQIQKCSTKYAYTIKTIINSNIAGRLCFVYCDFVAGSGAILLSKLLELFSFKRYQGDEDGGISSGEAELSVGKRYSIITNKTATTAQTRSILKTFNTPKNMNGDYISVIIGSRVIGEGFSLKNIQDIHILTPHWNYSETDQAIARGLRLFSHSDLENKGIIPIIKIYQYVAIPTGTGSSLSILNDSIDYKMYLISEDKDISIKSIERIIKESAFDCALNYKRNRIYNEDDMRSCDYQKCDYQCDGQQYQEILPDQLDYSTYNLYYDKNEMDDMISSIKDLFSKKNVYKLLELTAQNRYNKFTVLKSLDYIIQERIPILNIHSQLCYLKNYGDTFYLDISVDTDSSPTQPYYIENPSFFELKTVEELVYKYELKKLPDLIIQLEKSSSTAMIYENIFNNMTALTVELFIEASVLGEKQNIGKNVNLRKWILSRYQTYIKKIGDKDISTYLYYASDIPQIKKIRCLEQDKGKWVYCDIAIKDIETTEKKVEQLGELGYYGIYENKTNKFRIIDVSDPIKVGGAAGKGKTKDTRTKTTGRVCKSILKKDLVNMCIKLGIDYKDQSGIEQSVGELCKIIKQWFETNKKMEIR